MGRPAAFINRTVRRTLGIPPGIGTLLSHPTRVRLVVALLVSFAVALLELLALGAIAALMSVLTGSPAGSQAIDLVQQVTGRSGTDSLAVLFAAAAITLYIAKAVVALAANWWTLGFLQREQAETSTRLLTYYVTAPYELHLRRSTAQLVNTMNDAVGQVYGLVIGGSVAFFTDVLSIMAILVGLTALMPGPTLLAIVYFGTVAIAYQRWARPRLVHQGTEMLEANQGIFRAGTEGLGSIREVTLAQSQWFFVDRYHQARLRFARASRLTSFLTVLPKYLLEILFVVGIGLVSIAVIGAAGPLTTLTTVALFAAAGFRTLPSVVRLMASLSGIRTGAASVERVIADAALATSMPTPATTTEAPPLAFRHALEIVDVSFSYPGTGQPVVTDVDLRIPVGTSMALVGASGAGKSTLADIAQGLLLPSHGRVLADDEDVNADLRRWWPNVATVPQQVWLLDGTLRQNVAFGVPDPDIDDARVHAAIDMAQLGSWVATLPQGLDTGTGEGGRRLSGGQRQRIGIARALYRNPVFLVLDEATSALDNETEYRVNQMITRLGGRITLLVIAHRLSTVRHCDQIAFMQDGRVVALGTFDELVRTNPEFANLASLGSF